MPKQQFAPNATISTPLNILTGSLEKYATSNILEFKTERSKIFEETLDQNRKQIVRTLEGFDNHAARSLTALGGSEAQLHAAFTATTTQAFGTHLYGSQIRYAQQFGTTTLFDSQYFSAALDLCQLKPIDDELLRLVGAVIRMLSGAIGQDLVRSLNANLFDNQPQAFRDLDILHVGDMFKVNPTEAGEAAFIDVLSTGPELIHQAADANTIIKTLLRSLLERVIELNISYQALMDEYYPFLFKPRDSWAKFTKISVFLHAVNEYVQSQEVAALANLGSSRGYYHDVAEAVQDARFALIGVGTSNYTNLLPRALPAIQTYFLNGHIDEYLDPYRNRIVPRAEVAVARRFLAPLMFTQSGMKPMTSVEMSRRYVEYYDRLRECDKIIVVGFGFNGDDGHINGMLRHAVDVDKKRLVVLAYADPTPNDELRESYRRKIRLDSTEALHVLRVNADRTSDGIPWLEAALEA